LRKAAAGFRLPGAPDAVSATGQFMRTEDPREAVRPVSVAGGS
jgi:hypothetical protein